MFSEMFFAAAKGFARALLEGVCANVVLPVWYLSIAFSRRNIF